jgi:hypothetical protein
MLPKKGRRLPAWKGALAGRQAYANTIAELLKREHGRSHRAVKQVMELTDASERTVKHWMAAQHGPDTVFFLRLLANSPVIRAFVVGIIDSTHVPDHGFQYGGNRNLNEGQALETSSTFQRELTAGDRINVTMDDPIIDPINDGLNERQRWFLARVETGARCRAEEISIHWRVSAKTARRDVAAISALGLIRFTGARRNGRYRLTGEALRPRP